jgi:hypothetical protein
MRSLFCPLRCKLDTFSTRDAEYAGYQLGSPRAFVVCRNRVHDDARVDVGVNNPDGGNMFDGTFADSMKVGYGIEENDKVRDHAFRQGHIRSEEMDLICEGAR